jgi:hypothetical protein
MLQADSGAGIVVRPPELVALAQALHRSSTGVASAGTGVTGLGCPTSLSPLVDGPLNSFLSVWGQQMAVLASVTENFADDVVDAATSYTDTDSSVMPP